MVLSSGGADTLNSNRVLGQASLRALFFSKIALVIDCASRPRVRNFPRTRLTLTSTAFVLCAINTNGAWYSGAPSNNSLDRSGGSVFLN